MARKRRGNKKRRPIRRVKPAGWKPEEKNSPPIKRVESEVLEAAEAEMPAGGSGQAGRPAWAPDDVDLEKVPAPVRQAAVEVIGPVYRQLVAGVGDPLQRCIGLTLVHLMWLEILDQHEAKQEYLKPSSVEAPEDRSHMIDRHLRMLNTKVKVANCLTRLREMRRRDEAADKLTVDSCQLSVTRSRGGMPSEYGKCESCHPKSETWESADAAKKPTADNVESATQKTGERLGQILALAEKYKREAKKAETATAKVGSELLESRL